MVGSTELRMAVGEETADRLRQAHDAILCDVVARLGVEGMPEDEGRSLLQSLQDHTEERAPRYAHAWRPHDVLIWDNASVQHKASADFPGGEARRFWRYMVEGPRPVGALT